MPEIHESHDMQEVFPPEDTSLMCTKCFLCPCHSSIVALSRECGTIPLRIN